MSQNPLNGNHAANIPTPIYELHRGQRKRIGYVQGDTFHKQVVGSKHRLRAYNAWAVSPMSLEAARNAGADFVELSDIETGTTYRASIIGILQHGIEFDFGYGQQIRLPLANWTSSNANRQRWQQQGHRKQQGQKPQTKRDQLIQSSFLSSR